ncbi:MAG: hypothetical protein U5L09_20975 [Bacteroidales bacterium]|nr:hypothetical protein [Bacteroidales bacterium]
MTDAKDIHTSKNRYPDNILQYLQILLLIPAQAFSQKTAREELTPHLAELREEIKIYTDRMLYISGEPVWFNAEYTINSKKTRSLISKVMYIELVNEKGNAVVRVRVLPLTTTVRKACLKFLTALLPAITSCGHRRQLPGATFSLIISPMHTCWYLIRNYRRKAIRVRKRSVQISLPKGTWGL